MRPWLFIPFILLGCQWAEDETTTVTLDFTPTSVCDNFVDNEINGLIGQSMYLCEYDADETVTINSRGGAIYSAYVLGDFFEDDDVSLLVDGECSSACILLLTSQDRKVCEGSFFRLHAASSESGTQTMIHELRQDRRVDWVTIESLMRDHPYEGNTFHTLYPVDAKALGLVDDVVSCN